MPLSSVEGLIVSLLFLVPGGLGLRVRRHLYSQPSASAFWEALSALAASLVALLVLELSTGLYGALSGSPVGVGDSLVEPLLIGPITKPLPWGGYFVYFALALVLPVFGGWAVHTKWLRWLRAPSAHGLDFLIADVRPPEDRKVGPWMTVRTTSDDTFLGWLMWRSYPPDPLELVLGDVVDLDNPEAPRDPTWALWLPERSIAAAWVDVGNAAASLDAPEPDS